MKLHVEHLKEAYRKPAEQLERAARAREKIVKFSTDSDVLEPGTVVLLRILCLNVLIPRSMFMKYSE